MTTSLADDELEVFLRGLNDQGAPPAAVVGAAALRAASQERAAARPAGPALATVTDLRLATTSAGPAGLAARLYRPTPEDTPLVVYLHGGGWVFGGLDTHDRACRRLAERSGCAVLALDYRLAPEHPWPAAVDDAVEALRLLRDRADGDEVLGFRPPAVAVGGDSAGGTTAALACLRLRDESPEALPQLQVLVYANTDLADDSPSLRELGHGFGLELDDIAWFYAQWVPDPARFADPAVSPLRAPDLSGLPPAVVVTCARDPLRDQGEAYARRLAEAGVTTTVRREPGMVHNFLLWDLVSPACAAAGDRVADDLATGLRAGRPLGPLRVSPGTPSAPGPRRSAPARPP